MPNPSKDKGTRFENEVVKSAQEKNIKARRFWMSDGRSAGYGKDADVQIGDFLFQVKRRKAIPKWLGLNWAEVDGCIVRQDRDKPVVILDYDDFLDLIQK